MFDVGDVLIAQLGLPHYDLGSDPCHASLKDGKLTVTLAALPIAGEVGVEASVFVIDCARKPDVEDISLKRCVDFSGVVQIGISACRE